MPQSADRVLDHRPLFREPEYTEMFKNKRAKYECGHSDEKIKEVAEWTKSWEYREKNLAREHLVVNPNKACQPLGAVFAAAGFEGTMSFVHGSQGCAAYFRSHLSRHFKEPSTVVSSSMTEDAAVFGGLNNMVDGLANTMALYDPKMVAVCTSCIAEVIGDDLHAFIETSRQKGSVPENFDVPFAHTPSFSGSHVNGYDAMIRGVLEHFWKNASREPGSKINIIPGFDGYCVGNNRELKRILDLMGVDYTLVCDPSDNYDSPSDGEFRMYYNGTKLEDTKAALNAKATLSLQEYCTQKSLEYCSSVGQETASFHYPIGVKATDELLLKLSELSGKPIPDALTVERGRLVDAMSDSQAWLHGVRYAIYGDPDFVYGMTRFVMETGGEPVHCLATNGTKAWEEQMKELLASSPFGAGCQVWAGKDLWHLRSLLATEPADYIIGNSFGKYLERDLKIPLIRLTFPIFDRHHHHRFPTWGYQGGLQVLVRLLDKIFDTMDTDTSETGVSDYSFDLTR